MGSSGGAWNEIFSEKNLGSFAWAAYEVYDALTELEATHETLVLPSRGTLPFHQLAGMCHQFERPSGFTPKEILEGMRLTIKGPPFSRNTLRLPFTADPPEGREEHGSAEIRAYWVRVLKAILLGILNDDALLFYQTMSVGLFGASPYDGLTTDRPSSRFVFLDTVVSGRAICEIVDAFEQQGLNDYVLILLIDANGAKLDPYYRGRLTHLEAEGKARLIYVEALVTEDRGPAMTGMWCLSAPQVVSRGASVIRGIDDAALVGAATAFIRVSADPKLRNVTSTMMQAKLYFVMHGIIRVDQFKNPWSEWIRRARTDLVEHAAHLEKDGFSPLLTKETERITRSAIKAKVPLALSTTPIPHRVVEVQVSSSHVVRLTFSEEALDKTFREYEDKRVGGQQAIWYLHHDS